MPDEIQLTRQFSNIAELKRAFMPFVRDGGVFVPTDQVVHLGDMVHVTLALPEQEQTFSFYGEVIWIAPKSSEHLSGVGVHCSSDEGEAFQKAARLLIDQLKDDKDALESETI